MAAVDRVGQNHIDVWIHIESGNLLYEVLP